MPKRKPDSDFVSNNYLELYCNHLELTPTQRSACVRNLGQACEH